LIELLIPATAEDKAPLAIRYLRRVASGRTFDQLKSSNWESVVTPERVAALCLIAVIVSDR